MLERTHAQNTQTLLSSRIPRDTEHERYHPELEEELKECLFCLRRNEMMIDLEVDTDLIEQRIYRRGSMVYGTAGCTGGLHRELMCQK